MKLVLLTLFISGLAFAEGYESFNGIRIHSSCQEVFGNDFPQKVKAGLEKGVACLKRMELGSIPEANLLKLQSNYKNDKIMIACHEDFGGGKMDAHASGNEGQTVESVGLVHPYLSFNAGRREELLKKDGYIGQVAFHETIHNLGYSHGKTVEYPYACEECCFNEDPTKAAVACKICRSSYSEGVLSEQY